MAYVDVLPASSTAQTPDETGTGTAGCQLQAGNALTDNGTYCTIRAQSSTVNTNYCYTGVVELKWGGAGSLSSDTTITGIQFIFEAKGLVNDESDALQYKVSTDGGSSYSAYQDADLTGLPGTKVSPAVFIIPSSIESNPPFSLSDAITVSSLNSNDVRIRIKLNASEPDPKNISFDYVKIRLHYSDARPTYDNSSDEQVMGLGTLILNNGEMIF